MIVCSCNALSDKDVDTIIQSGVCKTADIYAAKKCRVQCGQCVPGIVCRLKAALALQEPCCTPEAEKQAILPHNAPALSSDGVAQQKVSIT